MTGALMSESAPRSFAARLVGYVRLRWPYAMLATVIVEFLLAFALMFTFPPGALMMIFVGFFTLAIAVLGAAALGAIDRALGGEG